MLKILQWGGFFEHVTCEPCLLFYHIAFLVMETVNTNLYLQKSCRFNATAEPDLNTPCDYEKQGVIFTSEINSRYRFAMFTFCTLFTILCACWSDEAGRRRLPLFYLPITGLIFGSLSGLLHSHFWHWNPIAAALSEMVCEMLSGGNTLMIRVCFIYICDVTTKESRTMRTGILWIVIMMSEQLGGGGVGFILRALGFFYSYLFCLVFAIISLVLALIFIKDVSVPVEKKPFFLQFFNPARVIDSMKVVFKEDLGKYRIIVGFLFAVQVMTFFTVLGEKTVSYLYFRYKFHWNERQYSGYVVYRGFIIIIGTMFCSVVLSKRFKVHDCVIGMFAGFWDIIASLCYLFAYCDWQFYAISLLDMFHGTAFSVSQSFYSKYYDKSEFGRLNAVQLVFGLILPTSQLVYNIIFQKTIDFFPSAFFLVSVSINVAVMLLYCSSYLLSKKFDQRSEDEKPE